MPSPYQQRRADQFISLGLQMLADKERQKEYQSQQKSARQERTKLAEEEKRRYDIQEKRRAKLGGYQEKRFAWEEEEYKKKQEYDILKKEFDVVNSLNQSGNIKEAAARLSNMYNKRYPDGNEIRIVFRDDLESQDFQTRPEFKGKEIAVFSKTDGILPFKTFDEVMRYTAANLNYDKYAKEYDAAMAKVADANNRETPFVGEDGDVYINTWMLGPGGILKRGEVKRYEGRVPAQKRTGLELKLKQAEKVLGRKLTEEEKQIQLGLKEKQKEKEKKATDISKRLDVGKKSLELALEPFATGRIYDEFGMLTSEAKKGLSIAVEIVRKDAAKEELTPQEKSKLKYAKKAIEVYGKVMNEVSEEYKVSGVDTKAGKPAWADYDIDEQTAAPGGLIKMHRTPKLGMQRNISGN